MTADVENYGLRYQLKAERVDRASGTIFGTTVAKAGVNAAGKFVYLDAAGNLMRKPEGAVKKLQVKTDEKTLATLMAAAAAAGGSTKSREDHDDSIGARAGYADNFKTVGDRVTCDLHLFDGYENRDLVLETAEKTPNEIGLSIDMVPEFEIVGEVAMMRISELSAVDIVDAGAITPAGLFLKKDTGTVDNLNDSKTTTHMATDKKPATIEDCMTALSALAESHAALSASIAKMVPGAVKDAKDGDGKDKSAAGIDELKMQLAKIVTDAAETKELIGQMKAETAALGLKVTTAVKKEGTADDSAAETERMRLAAEKSKGEKPYLQLVAEKETAEAGKMKRSECHRFVQQASPKAYAAHLASKGAIKAA